MQVFGTEKEFVITKQNENMGIVYSAYSNKVLAINEYGMQVFSDIVNEATNSNGSIDKLYSLYEAKQLDEFVKILFENKILFRSYEDMKNADYMQEYKKRKCIFPHKAYLHLTQRCNLRCKYCYNAANIGKASDLDTYQWKLIVDKLKDECFDYLVFTGGEVMLRKDLLELAQYVKQQNMKLHILTNGTMQIPRELIETADAIEISLDAVDYVVNERNRINSKKFGVYENILKIPIELRNKIIIKTVLSRENADSIVKTREKLKENGYLRNEIMLCQPNSPQEIGKYPEQIIPRIPHPFDAGMLAKCNACYEVIAVNADGNIYPCQAMIKSEFKLASIFDENWIEVVKHGKITAEFYNDDISTSECKNCKFKYICGGPCKAISYNTTGSLFKGREFYCERAKKEAIEYLRSIEFGGQK